MPEYYDEMQTLAGSGGRSRRRLFAILGVLGLAAAGGAVWTLHGGSTGTLPTVSAEAGPAKTRPEGPGAKRARYAEVESYRVIDGDVPLAPGEARFAPEPGRPAEEDMPMSKIAAVTALPSAPRPPSTMAPRGMAGGSVTAAARPGMPAAVAPAAPGAARLGTAGLDGERLAALHADDGLFDAPEAMTPPRVHRLIPSEMDLLETVRPVRRIVSEQAEPSPPRGVGSEVAPPVSPVVRARPASLGRPDERSDLARAAERSPVQIQLGAFPELDIIQSEWRRVSEANSDVLGDRAMAVQQTQAGGVTYYRLRVGPFRNGQEANTVCQALKTRGYECLVAINTESRG